LWSGLRELSLPYNVRRQHPLGRYVADFTIPARKLVIEIDGGQHAAVARMEADVMRTRDLDKLGYRVLRFWNNEVLQNFDSVLEVILAAIVAPPPLPDPLRPQGRRGK
jgi:very-short-patch-repair endonuclease